MLTRQANGNDCVHVDVEFVGQQKFTLRDQSHRCVGAEGVWQVRCCACVCMSVCPCLCLCVCAYDCHSLLVSSRVMVDGRGCVLFGHARVYLPNECVDRGMYVQMR